MQFEILTDKGTPIKLVRFFMLNEKQFLIYSDVNEGVDDQGHLTIHISEIKNEGHIVADVVSDLDWENVKNIIKGIVNANKNNQPLPIQDLDYNAIDGVSIVGDKALKLMANYVELLKTNQPLFEKKVVEDIIKPTEENNTTEVDVSNNNIFNSELNTDTSNVYGMSQQNENESYIPSFNDVSMVGSSVNLNSEIDYQKLYEEQVELVNRLQSEISDYQNKIETLKNIINN